MKPRTLSLALRDGSRDTVLIAGFFLVIDVLLRIRRGQDIVAPGARTITLSLVVLLVTWTAMVIACRLGASTLTDYRHVTGKNSVPGTFAVFIITSMVTFIALLFMGLVE